jgi:glycosyltransferase involved in cell wall biosynthesis
MKYSILHTEWSTGWGGQEIRILTECELAHKTGHKIYLAGRKGAPILKRAAEMGLETAEFGFSGSLDLGSALGIRRFILNNKIDILHTHSSVDSWVGVWADMMSPAALFRSRHCGSIRVHKFNLVYTRPKAFITIGEQIRKDLIEGYHLAPERAVSIPTGISLERYIPREPDPEVIRQFGIEPGTPLVGICAVLRSWKRHDLFCEMAARLHELMPEVRFLIIGDGPYREKVEGFIDSAGVRDITSITGHREDVEQILPHCQVVVLNSQGEEGTSQALAQALACHCGVVTADQGSVTDVVLHEKTGLVTRFGDTAAMAQACQTLLKDPDMRLSLAKAGREHVKKHFSDTHMHERITRFYERLVPRHWYA